MWSEQILPRIIDRLCGSAPASKLRARALPRAGGRVLEIGGGSGLNFAHVEAARIASWVSVEPSEHLRSLARDRARDHSFPFEAKDGRGEALPFGDACFDTVVLTYTYCTVSDPERVRDEMARVLEPGGTVIFVEHGAALGRAARKAQGAFTGAWSTVAGGCQLDRDLPRDLEADARFTLEESHVRSNFPSVLATLRYGWATRN